MRQQAGQQIGHFFQPGGGDGYNVIVNGIVAAAKKSPVRLLIIGVGGTWVGGWHRNGKDIAIGLIFLIRLISEQVGHRIGDIT